MSPSRRRRPQSLAGIRILVVEDDDDIREIFAYTLGVEGATVTAVSTAREALLFLSSVDIILTDFALPGNDGVWLLEQVNKQPRRVPVIAISSFDESQQPRLAAAPFAGNDDLVAIANPLEGDRPPRRPRPPPPRRARRRARGRQRAGGTIA